MTEKEFEQIIIDLFSAMSPDNYEAMDETEHFVQNDLKNVRTFQDAGLLTGNCGVVVYAKDGSEYQITVVKSK